MPFKRTFGASYPAVYETWTDGDSSWVIQDLRPEDDEEAIEILIDHLCADETLCQIQKLSDDPPSVHHMCEFWREILKQRMSLGCYVQKNGQTTLAALNVCVVASVEEGQQEEVEGEKWKNVHAALMYTEHKTDAHEFMGLDVILFAMGLVVKREFRGARLGRRLLAARTPLSKSQGIKGTATVFTGIASQKLAASCDFQTIAEVSISELADVGLPYPRDDHRTIKYMVKKFE